MATAPAMTALARKFRLQVNTGTAMTPTWTTVAGITELKPKIDPTLQDSGDYESDGWQTKVKTALEWGVEATFLRRTEAGVYDTAQEYLRARQLLFGSDGWAHIRWYDRTGGPEAYEGYAELAWEQANSGLTDLDAAKVTLSGAGPLESIASPV